MMKSIIKGYIELPESKRKIVKEYIESLIVEITANANISIKATAPHEKASNSDTTPTSLTSLPPTYKDEEDPEILAEMERYYQELQIEKKVRSAYGSGNEKRA